MSNLYGSICLSDIPKELITEGKNGKKYLNIVINERKEVSQFGMTHYMKAYCKKENQREGVNYYIGDLKPSNFQGGNSQDANVQRNYMKGASNAVASQAGTPQSYEQSDVPF